MAYDPLNAYGDRLVPTTGTHGGDIAGQRIDELDEQAIQYVLRNRADQPVCIDLGCGLGWQGARFAMLGARAFLFDLLPESQLVQTLRAAPGIELQYAAVDLRTVRADALPANIGMAFSQRFIHYVRYREAVTLVKKVAARMVPGGQFLVSASGIDSELGTQYRGKNVDIGERFAPLHPAVQQKHGIFEHVCLYSQDELNGLMVSCGFRPVESWTSSFGNIKSVFQRAP
jgi:hypothetical protein